MPAIMFVHTPASHLTTLFRLHVNLNSICDIQGRKLMTFTSLKTFSTFKDAKIHITNVLMMQFCFKMSNQLSTELHNQSR